MNLQCRTVLKSVACAIIVALMLTACGKKELAGSAPPSSDSGASGSAVSMPAPSSGSEADSPGSSADTPSQAAPSASPPSGQDSSPPVSSSGEAADSNGQETPQSSPAAAEPKYRMNKAYRIVPIDKTETSDKVVLLTFDDGPKEAGMLGKILDTLDKHDAKAIFFVNGYRVKANPDLLKEIDARGQVIGNHSYDHINLRELSEEKIREQIEGVQQIVREVTGKTPEFFRPPFGASNDAVKAVARENGMLFMTWSNGSLDWDLGKKVSDKPQAVIDNVMEQLHPGSNILMHELEWTADALDQLLTQLREKGYSFVDPREIEISLE